MNSSPKKVIEFKNVTFQYSNQKDPILKNVSFEIYAGEYVMVVGRNGSGKSTLIKLLSGLLNLYKGKIYLFGENLASKKHAELVRKVGIVFQNPESQFIGTNVEKDLVFPMENLNYSFDMMRNKLLKIVKQTNLQPILFDRPEELAAGEKQKVAFAASMITEPEILFLDEPTSLLSPVDQEVINKLIDNLRTKQKQTIVEINHQMNRLDKVDRIMVINDNKISFFGTLDELKKKQLLPLKEVCGESLPLIYELNLEALNRKILEKPIWNKTKLIKKIITWQKQ